MKVLGMCEIFAIFRIATDADLENSEKVNGEIDRKFK